jgi:hypothetical protein
MTIKELFILLLEFIIAGHANKPIFLSVNEDESDHYCGSGDNITVFTNSAGGITVCSRGLKALAKQEKEETYH